MGSGVHGYLYNLDVPLAKPGKAKMATTNYAYVDRDMLARMSGTDPSMVEVKPELFIEYTRSFDALGTNNQAEMYAMYDILDQLNKLPDVVFINVWADSNYVLKGLTEYCAAWQRNNWLKRDGNPPANVELWRRLYALYISMGQSGKQIKLDWIKGHSGAYGNMLADFMAGVGIRRSYLKDCREEFRLLEPKEFNVSEVGRNPMFAYRRMYFNSIRDNNEPGVYYMANPGKLKTEAMEGRRVTDAAYSVVMTTEPDDIIEMVIDRHCDVHQDKLAAIVRVDVDRLFNKTIVPMLDRFGGLSLIEPVASKKSSLIFALDGDPVTEPQDPIGMTMVAVTAMTMLQDMLEWYHLSSKADPENTSILKPMTMDITDRFFAIEETKKGPRKVLRKEINSQMAHMDVEIVRDDIDSAPIAKLMLGLDILPRNNLKRLEEHDPVVMLITWKESENVLRYGTIITSTIGSGIWANYFANKLLTH